MTALYVLLGLSLYGAVAAATAYSFVRAGKSLVCDSDLLGAFPSASGFASIFWPVGIWAAVAAHALKRAARIDAEKQEMQREVDRFAAEMQELQREADRILGKEGM